MIILRPTTEEQTLQVYVRKEAANYNIVLTDEETLVKNTIDISATYADGMLTFNLSFAFKSERFYWMYVNDQDTGLNLNKTKIYITDQADYQVYSMTEGYYKEIEKPEKRYYVRK